MIIEITQLVPKIGTLKVKTQHETSH